MGDDFTTDDILSGDTDTDSTDFDPNAVESDDFLDDPEEELLDADVDDLGLSDDDDEGDDIFGEDE